MKQRKNIVLLVACFTLLMLLLAALPLNTLSAANYPKRAELLVPYLSQYDDIPIGFSFSRACGVTSAAMVLGYYGRVAPYTIKGMDGTPTDYGWYISRAYHYKSVYNDVTWNYFANQEQRPGLQGWGAWGFIWRNGTDKTSSDVLPFLARNDVLGTIIWRPSKSYVQQRVMQEINAGHPLMVNSDKGGGHYMVIYGYDATQSVFKYLVNDPWNGRMVYTFEQLEITQPFRGLIPTWPNNGFTAKVPYSPQMSATQSYVKPLYSVYSADTVYTYELPLVVPEKVTPTVIVYVDGKPYKMILAYGTPYSGTYQYKTALKSGTHNYYFVVSTNNYTVWLPPDAGVWGSKHALTQFNGPFVENGLSTATNVELQVMNDKFLINGKPHFLDMPPIIKSGRTLLPISDVVKALGGTITWDSAKQKVTITLKKGESINTIELWIGSRYAYVNGKRKLIDESKADVVPIIANGRTLLPLRFIVDNLSATIAWDNAAKIINVISK
ncbi:stalk domain-containing protein [Coprothermobacter platensis]|uniref:stalk domain-containing protein n=1 Tax=Coprothermobacter platensis TaxID=108819 RepID=UPI00037CFFFE|nr:stalk domain-containing protein [Coprothermobacter platensis]